MSTYCNVAEFSDTIPNFVIEDSDSLQLMMDIAERDVDMALGPGYRNPTTGLKIDPTTLVEFRRLALSRAVAYQTEYRLVKGDAFFVNLRPDARSGPEGSFEGREPYIAPKAQMELSYGNLYRLVTGHGRRGNVYDIPNQNIDQESW